MELELVKVGVSAFAFASRFALSSARRIRFHSTSGTGPRSCVYWLRYVGSIAWGVPPLGQGHRPYLSSAALSLHRADGQLMATSAYAGDDSLARWASTRKKIAPVVKALITGFET